MTISTCNSDGICTYLEEILQALPNLPSMSRFDSTEYMRARDSILVDFFKSEQRELEELFNESEAESSCSLYMAMSSIPNSGFGIYVGKDLHRGDKVDRMPQVVVPLVDLKKKSLLDNYPWTAAFYGAHVEDEETMILFPALGMLANSHLGLVNVMQRPVGGMEILDGSVDRSLDVGAGASSQYHSSSWYVLYETKGIERGSELFVDYGINYFRDREKEFDTIFPTGSNYKQADSILRSFALELGDSVTAEDEQRWTDIIAKLQDGNEDDIRVAYALPDSVQEIRHAADIGTARYSIPDSIRSIEWLEENGMCLDNLRKGSSDIPHAGHGAFAMKEVQKGETVVPFPVLPVRRDVLDYEGNKSNKKQLLLNYCFGHPQSSMLLFPYSSSINFINHSDTPNSYVTWSSSSMSNNDNFNSDVNDVSTGLIMEVVALRDIPAGEEVTINYGSAWVQAWDQHVRSWKVTDKDLIANPKVTAKKMNEELNTNTGVKKPIKTISEQEGNPYPKCVRTACYSYRTSGQYAFTPHQLMHVKFCDVVDRYRKGGRYYYGAKISGLDDIVTDIPEEAVVFMAGENCNDMHLENAFRHEMHVTDGMYPDIWLDLS